MEGKGTSNEERTARRPSARDRKHFDLMHFVLVWESQQRDAVLMVTHNEHLCEGCKVKHKQLVTFYLEKQ